MVNSLKLLIFFNLNQIFIIFLVLSMYKLTNYLTYRASIRNRDFFKGNK